MSTPASAGAIVWTDLTVPDAERVRAFYEAVAGWSAAPVDMEGYHDYSMHTSDSSPPVAGICHARGENAALPPQWLVYIRVTNLDASVAACTQLGGRLVTPVRTMGGGRMAVIADPAGAVAALLEMPDEG